ncbi:MAG: PIN domain-containing protein [Sneathiellaceae bacterium]
MAKLPLRQEPRCSLPVLTRPEHLVAFRLTEGQAIAFLGYLAGIVDPVRLHYLWRPQLADVADERVLETAINGRADCLVTFKIRHFAAAGQFGIDVIQPEEALRRIQ